MCKVTRYLLMKKYCSDICSDVQRVLIIPEVATKGGQVGCPVWLKLSSLLLSFVGRGSLGIRFVDPLTTAASHQSLTPVEETANAQLTTLWPKSSSVSTDMGQKEALAGQK